MKKRQKENGQSMLELALLLPFLMLLLVATVEAGFALRDYLMLQSVNREGVRFAVRTPPGDEYRDHFYNEEIPAVFDRILVAADEGGLRPEDVSVIFTHVYIDRDGSPQLYKVTYPPLFDYPPGFDDDDVVAIAEENAAKAARINATRETEGYDRLWNEVVIIEAFYRHETLWGFDVGPFGVGPLGKDWTMYARSTMRMVGTGRLGD